MTKRSNKKKYALMTTSFLLFSAILPILLFQTPIMNNKEKGGTLITPIPELKTSAEDEVGNLSREMFPIVLNRELYPNLVYNLNNKDYSTIRVAVFHANNKTWQLFPFQIDEWGSVKIWDDTRDDISKAMSGSNDPDLHSKTTYVPFDGSVGNGQFNSYDEELIFYARNGDKSSDQYWALPEFEHRIELKIVDPSDYGTTWMYIYYSDESDGRPNSITGESWYEEYVSWDPKLLEISTDVYSLNIDFRNFDIINSIIIKDTDENSLTTEFGKSFGVMSLAADTCNMQSWTGMKGTWDGVEYGYKTEKDQYFYLYPNANPMRSKDTAIDDPTNSYFDGDEGNLARGPTANNDISCAGDRMPVTYGSCRVILLFQTFEYSNNGKVTGFDACGYVHGFAVKKFYYDRIEEGGGGDNQAKQTDPVGLYLHYGYSDIFSLNNDIKQNMTVYYGLESEEVVACYPDDGQDNGRGFDYYEVDGDPNGGVTGSKGGPWNVPSLDNPDLADWCLLTSDSNGGMWKALGGPERRYARDNWQSTNFREINMYWMDSPELTELGMEVEIGYVNIGLSLGSYTQTTIFGNFKTGNNQTGADLYELYNAMEDGNLLTYTVLDKPNWPFFISVETDQEYYQDGDIITIDIECDGDDYNLTADFSELDSGYTPGEENVVDLPDSNYRINYTIDPSNSITPGYLRVNITAVDEVESTNNSYSLYIALYPSDLKFIDIKSITSDSGLLPGSTYYLIVNISSLTDFDLSLDPLTLDALYLNDKWGSAITNITCTLPLGTLPYSLSGGTTSFVAFNYTMDVDSNAPPGPISINASCGYVVIDTGQPFTQENATIPYSGTVIDNILPKLFRSPGNLTLVDGSPPVDLIWTLFDYEPAYYNITRDGTTVKGGSSWSANDPIYYQIIPSGLAFDTEYDYKISVNDTTGNSAWSSVFVTKASGIDVAISNEYDVEFVYGDYVPDIRWIPSWDDINVNPAAYEINVYDGISWNLEQNGDSWDQNGINLTIIDWLVGNYSVNCSISDSDGTWIWDIVNVTVNNDIPEITQPDDISIYISGSTGNYINWTVTDDAYGIYPYYNVTYRQHPSGSIISLINGSWQPDVAIDIDIDGLSPSSQTLYNFTIYIHDGLGGAVADTVFVTVTPNDIPVLKSLGDIAFEEGEEGYQLVWTLRDRYADGGVGNYTIYCDDIVVFSSTYMASSQRLTIIYNVSSILEINNYTFILSVDDGYGGIVNNSVNVEVFPWAFIEQLTVWEQILEQFGFFIQLFFAGYVAYVILHRRNFNLQKIRLKDPIYQSKQGIKYEKKYDNQSLDQKDELILDGSIRQFKYAIMVDPKLPEPHYNLAIALMEKGQIDESIKEFKKVIALKPKFAEAYNNLGIALATKGEFDEAIESFKEALKINPEFTAAKTNLEIALEDKDGEYWARFGVQ